jgi:hypothetical protein
MVITSVSVFSQKFILLQKGSSQKNRLKFEIGETFIYKTKKNNFYITDVIKDIQKDIIVLSENVLLPEDITSIYILHKDPRNSTLKNLSYMSYGAATVLMSANLINSLYQDGTIRFESGGLITSGILFASGFTFSKIGYKHFKIHKRNKIQLITLYGD